MAPMKAGYDFLQTVRSLSEDALGAAKALEVRLFRSLSATGKGHGTDRAVLAELLGQDVVRMTHKNIIFDSVEHDFPFNNTLIIRLLGEDEVVFEREYYSVGGGFLQWKGWKEPKRGTPVYKYENMAQMKWVSGMPISK
jgi:L-serine dehydratase